MGELAGHWPTPAPSPYYPLLKSQQWFVWSAEGSLARWRLEEPQGWSLREDNEQEVVEGRASCWYPGWALFLSVTIYVDLAISSRATTPWGFFQQGSRLSPWPTHDHRSHTDSLPTPSSIHTSVRQPETFCCHLICVALIWENAVAIPSSSNPIFFHIHLGSIGKEANDDSLNIEEWSEINSTS